MKRKFVTLILTMLIPTAFGVSVMAQGDLISGFYDIGNKQNVELTVFSGDVEVSVTEKNIDTDETLEQLYENSNRVEVIYAEATKNAYYGAILVDSTGLPTKDTEIYYVDQKTAQSESVDFNIYPKLPDATCDMSLYISSDADGFELVNIPVSYAVNASANVPEYTLGDVDGDGLVDVRDVVLIRRHLAGGYGVELLKNAADVDKNSTVDVTDVITLRRYIAGGYGIELK